MIMQIKSYTSLSEEESEVLARACKILEEIADKANRIDCEIEFDGSDDMVNIDEIARFGKDISDMCLVIQTGKDPSFIFELVLPNSLVVRLVAARKNFNLIAKTLPQFRLEN